MWKFKLNVSRRTKIVVGVVVLLVAVISVDVYKTYSGVGSVMFSMWYNRSPYSSLPKGFSADDVIERFGEPTEVAPNYHFYEVWDYDVTYPGDNHETLVQDKVTIYLGVHGKVSKMFTLNDYTHVEEHELLWPEGKPKVGMTKQEVMDLIGKPGDTWTNQETERWLYKLWNGSMFIVMFDSERKVIGSHVVHGARARILD